MFSQGGVYLSAEGAEYTLTPLPQSFAKLIAEEKYIGGRPVLELSGGGHRVIISEYGKVIFSNPAESAEYGDTLTVTVPFETCTAAKAICRYGYDGDKLALISSETIESAPPEENILHFAFFESVLTRGNFEKYLCDELKPRAGDLKGYLGDFVSVTVPPEKFYAVHGDAAAAGLVYPKSNNLYEVKYFAAEITDGKISNIYPVE